MVNGTGLCRIGGVDLAALGWLLISAEGVRALPRLEAVHRAMPGRTGLMRTGRSTPTARTIVLQGTIDAHTPEAIEAVRDAVLAVAAAGPVTIECATRPGIAWVGELVSDQVTHLGEQLLASYPTHTLTFTCANPFGLDVEPSIVGWSSATDRALLACGTAPMDLTVRVFGPATNPEVPYCNHRGEEIGRLMFNVVLGASDWLVASSGTYRVTLVTAGVETDGINLLAAGSRFFAVDPTRDADLAAESWPSVYGTSGTGEVSCRRAWL